MTQSVFHQGVCSLCDEPALLLGERCESCIVTTYKGEVSEATIAAIQRAFRLHRAGVSVTVSHLDSESDGYAPAD